MPPPDAATASTMPRAGLPTRPRARPLSAARAVERQRLGARPAARGACPRRSAGQKIQSREARRRQAVAAAHTVTRPHIREGDGGARM